MVSAVASAVAVPLATGNSHGEQPPGQAPPRARPAQPTRQIGHLTMAGLVLFPLVSRLFPASGEQILSR